MRRRPGLSLLIALTILVSALARPPGTMLVLEGESLTYEICTGEGVQVIDVDGEPHEIDIGCDFFAAHIAMVSAVAPDAAPVAMTVRPLQLRPAVAVAVPQSGFTPYNPRSPPVSIRPFV